MTNGLLENGLRIIIINAPEGIMAVKMSREIGGFLSLDLHTFQLMHAGGIFLNSGRNALRYIIRVHKLKKLQVPYYTCPEVWRAVEVEQCECIPYDIDEYMFPVDITTALPILYTNYFGVCTNNLQKILGKFPFVIVDNAQAFFANDVGDASFYSPRKFFGLPDGGIAVTKKTLSEKFPVSVSWERCTHLLRRIDASASAAYADFQINEEYISRQPIKYISKCTLAILKNINMETVIKTRKQNFNFLHNYLCSTNELSITLYDNDVPLVYPYKTHKLYLRGKCIRNDIFVARYWPASYDSCCMTSHAAQQLADTILPLPIDQRYGEEDMQRILEVICV